MNNKTTIAKTLNGQSKVSVKRRFTSTQEVIFKNSRSYIFCLKIRGCWKNIDKFEKLLRNFVTTRKIIVVARSWHYCVMMLTLY